MIALVYQGEGCSMNHVTLLAVGTGWRGLLPLATTSSATAETAPKKIDAGVESAPDQRAAQIPDCVRVRDPLSRRAIERNE